MSLLETRKPKLQRWARDLPVRIAGNTARQKIERQIEEDAAKDKNNRLMSALSEQMKHRRPIPYAVYAPIYDHTTSNRSFITVHRQLKELGIENNEFFLILYNRSLIGVNPFDPDITPEQALMVVQECQINFYYFIRECVRIPSQGSSTVQFNLDRATLAGMYCFINDINFYLMKPRQTGKSVGICAMLAWAFKFGVTNGEFQFSANKEKIGKDNLARMKRYISLLPSYIGKLGTVTIDQQGKTVRKTDNVKSYREPRNGNSATVANCAISEEIAEQIGRGDSHVFEFYDEAEFTAFIDVIVKVSGMAFNTASRNAIANGAHACRIFATTPGDLSDEKRCGSAMKIVNDALPWDEKYYDIPIFEFKEILAKKSEFNVVYIEYDYKSLGLSESWYRDACKQVGGDQAKIRREILLQRFSGNSKSPFTQDEITEISDGCRKPVWSKTVGKLKYELNFYITENEIKKNRPYVVALDPSDGLGQDYYAMTVIDPYTLQIVCEFRNNLMDPPRCKELLEFTCSQWFQKPILVIENNKNGHSLISFFDQSWLKPRIYRQPEASMDTALIREDLDEQGFLKEQLRRRKFLGVNTNPTTRDMMMSLLVDAVHFRKDILNTEYIVDDIKNLELKNNKIQAAPGKHDDSIMSWCLGMYIIYYGKNLENWGFHRGELPPDVTDDDEYTKLQELYRNPLVQKYFPTMYQDYMNNVRDKLKISHEETVKQAEVELRKTGMGSIIPDIQKEHPEYTPGRPDYQANPDEAWKANLLQRFASLNRPRRS